MALIRNVIVALFALTAVANAQSGPNGGITGPTTGTTVTPSGTFTPGDVIVGGPGATQVQDITSVFNGTSRYNFTAYSPVLGSAISYGTAGTPITTAGPLFKFSRTENIAAATCGNNSSDNECNATLAIYSVGTASDAMQVASIYAGAQTAGAVGAVGILSVGLSTGSSSGIGTGAYLEGRSSSASGGFLGAEIRATNVTGVSKAYSSGGYNNGTLWLTPYSSIAANVDGCGICFGSITSGDAGHSQFDVGIGFTAEGGGGIKTASIIDSSASATSIQINGTHATAQIAGTGFSIDGSGNYTGLKFIFTGTTACAAGEAGVYLNSANTLGLCSNGFATAYVQTGGLASNRFTVLASNNPTNGINLIAASSVGFYANSAEVFRITGGFIQYTNVATGTPAASLCIDSSNNIIKKTTTGACI